MSDMWSDIGAAALADSVQHLTVTALVDAGVARDAIDLGDERDPLFAVLVSCGCPQHAGDEQCAFQVIPYLGMGQCVVIRHPLEREGLCCPDARVCHVTTAAAIGLDWCVHQDARSEARPDGKE